MQMIIHQLPCPHTPEQINVVEGKHPHIVDRLKFDNGHTFIQHSFKCWVEGI